MSSTPLSIDSSFRLLTGHTIPLLGYGVYLCRDVKQDVLEAFKAGYRHIDSAQYYENEAGVGEAVRASGIPREEIFVTSKIMSENGGYEKTLQLAEESINKFDIGYVDLFLIHDPCSGKDIRLSTYKALLELKAAGKIRSVGVSNYGIHHIEEIKAAGLETPVVNQIEIHPFCQQRPIVKYCQENGILVQAYCPLIRGKLDFPVFVEISEKYKRDPAQILLRWSLQKGLSPLPKSSTPSRILSNSQLFDFEISEEDMAKLDALDKGAEGAVSWNPVNVE